MTQSWLPVGTGIPCFSRHLPVRAFFPMTFELLEVSLIVSIALRNFGRYTRACIVYLVLNIISKSVKVGAKGIFPIYWNNFGKTKPVKYM